MPFWGRIVEIGVRMDRFSTPSHRGLGCARCRGRVGDHRRVQRRGRGGRARSLSGPDGSRKEAFSRWSRPDSDRPEADRCRTEDGPGREPPQRGRSGYRRCREEAFSIRRAQWPSRREPDSGRRGQFECREPPTVGRVADDCGREEAFARRREASSDRSERDRPMGRSQPDRRRPERGR